MSEVLSETLEATRLSRWESQSSCKSWHMTWAILHFKFTVQPALPLTGKWNLLFFLLLLIKIHCLRLQMCMCPFWNTEWIHFLTQRVPPSYHHTGFYMSKSPSEQFKQHGSLLPCSWPFISWPNYLSRILTAHQQLLVKQFHQHMHSARQCIGSQSTLTCTTPHEDTAQIWSKCCTQRSTGNNSSLPRGWQESAVPLPSPSPKLVYSFFSTSFLISAEVTW